MHEFRQENDLNMQVPNFKPWLVWFEGAKFKLMCGFSTFPNGKLILRLECDSSILSKSQIQRIQLSITIAMRLLSSGNGHNEVKHALEDVQAYPISDSCAWDSKCCFGKSLRDL